MSIIKSKRVTRSQLEKMADFMEKYPQLFNGIVGRDFEKSYKDRLWRELADTLNAEEDSPQKSALKWRKCFKDYKCYVKKKYLSYLADSSNLSPLSHLDVRMLSLMGYVMDIEGMDYSSNNHLAYILEEINGDAVENVIYSPVYKEQNPKFYRAPEIITLQQKDANSTPMVTQDNSEITSNKENSENVEETSSNKDSSNKEETQDDEELAFKEELAYYEELAYNVESPRNEESSCNEELPYSEKMTNKKSVGKKSRHKKQSSTIKKKRGGNSKNATASALQAIAKELNMKNELTKMKIELEKEKLVLEKRKIEAFELIAKRLYRKR